jgi:hypothetical protein
MPKKRLGQRLWVSADAVQRLQLATVRCVALTGRDGVARDESVLCFVFARWCCRPSYQWMLAVVSVVSARTGLTQAALALRASSLHVHTQARRRLLLVAYTAPCAALLTVLPPPKPP